MVCLVVWDDVSGSDLTLNMRDQGEMGGGGRRTILCLGTTDMLD